MRPGQEAPDDVLCLHRCRQQCLASMRPGQEAPDDEAEAKAKAEAKALQ